MSLPPSISILLISMLVSFITSLANRLLINREQLNAWRREVKEWTSEFNKARRADDKKLLAQVQKQQPRIMQIQKKMAWQSMKVFPISTVVVLVVWWLVLIPTYGQITVAYLPWNLPWFGGEEFLLNLFYWYLLCSFLFGALFSRAFGLAMGMGATK
ncbi:MAG: EMC3/TMCO1 family protein [Candidatus Bathyarchaeia archaeon]